MSVWALRVQTCPCKSQQMNPPEDLAIHKSCQKLCVVRTSLSASERCAIAVETELKDQLHSLDYLAELHIITTWACLTPSTCMNH